MEHSKLYTKNMGLSDEKFKQIIGVKKETFEKMLEIVTEAYAQKHRRRGRHSKLSIDEILFMTLKYWREYVTQISLAHEFGVGEATVHDWIVWVELVLVKSGTFTVKGKRELLTNPDLEIAIIDATESPVQRPKRGRKNGIPESKKTTQQKLN
jgi:transposase